MILHKLLQRQIKKHLTEEMLLDPMMNKFISSINDSYNSFDRDKEIIEHAFTVSESEYSEVNHSLQKEVILKRISIQKLKDALVKIDSDYPIHAEREDDDILTIVDYLNHQIEKRKQMEEQIIWQEEKYRNIIANMNLGLLEVDNNDVIQFANQSFCDMSGYTIDELIGKRGNAIALSENEKDLISSKNELRKAGASDMYTIAIKNKAGEIRWWVISGAPRYNDKGELIGTVGVHLDVTDQKNMEEELKVAKLRAEDSSKAKETFLATMSHEIRTPLNAIIGITDLMKTNQKSRNKENLDILSFSSKNLLALITDILDLSKIDAGKIEICKNPIEIKALLNGIFQTFKPIGEEKDVELILNIEDSIPEIINGDELRLSQILNNLLSNALKFTPKGYVKLSVKAVPIDNNLMRFEFKLTDTGIGIKKNKLDSIFNDFEQADAEIVRHYGGTGLGLGITKKLIELHGGTITVESKINFGTTFSFTIDYEVSKETVKKKSDKRGGSKIVKLFTIKNKTVLLVEDNIANQKVATSYLSKWGLKSKVANNGK